MQSFTKDPKARALFAPMLSPGEKIVWAAKGTETLTLIVAAMILADVIMLALAAVFATGALEELTAREGLVMLGFTVLTVIGQFLIFRTRLTRYFCLTNQRLLKAAEGHIYELTNLPQAQLYMPEGARFLAFGDTVEVRRISAETTPPNTKQWVLPSIAGVPDLPQIADHLTQTYDLKREQKSAFIMRLARQIMEF
ncbi:hypothetical protein [Ponticaulis sp.]|uniref:hypothetical protein n=1 Tax=Ponticaulis sp. TaxID=2020902 RepID=UPI00262770B7|nr:hypothetical protein [Ponticaulis sp.]MDF1679370.1 hypothetical protein [Ponticaulis sp.]